MNREEFYEEVLKEMSHTVENAEVSLNRTTKNNGIVGTGITIRTTNSSISPVIYLDEMYTTYESNQNMEEIVTTVLDIYNKSIIENPVQANPDMFRWEAAKENLFIKVVNYAANQKQLEELVHEIFLDLAIIPCIQVDMKDEALGSVTVNKNLADTWGISDEEIIFAAKKNTPELFDVLMKPLFEMIKSLLSIDEKDELQDFQEPGIYVLTNKMNIHGAMFLGISEVLEETRQKLGVESFYILPSSIHECLIITEKNLNPKELRKMVRDVNNSHVQPDEVLSYVPTMKERGEPIAFYALFKLDNGGYGFEVMSKQDIDEFATKYSKGISSAYSPWKTNYEDMANVTYDLDTHSNAKYFEAFCKQALRKQGVDFYE